MELLYTMRNNVESGRVLVGLQLVDLSNSMVIWSRENLCSRAYEVWSVIYEVWIMVCGLFAEILRTSYI